MRILSSLNDIDPLFAIGERVATPRTAPVEATASRHDWSCALPSDLDHPEAAAIRKLADHIATIHAAEVEKAQRDALVTGTGYLWIGVDEGKGDMTAVPYRHLTKPGRCDSHVWPSFDEFMSHGGDPRITPDSYYDMRMNRYVVPTERMRNVYCNGCSANFEQWFRAGWTVDQLVSCGHATIVEGSL